MEKNEITLANRMFQDATVGMLAIDKILKKIGEETTEVIIGAKNKPEEAIFEIADLTYHILVLMVELGISLSDIRKELGSRHIIDHKVKQETMQ